MSMQKELQKQLNVMVSVPITKEGRRLEGSLGRSLEKVVKANTDALWAHFQEENAKQEKLERDRTQQIMNLMTNFVNKDLQAMLEKILKKEIAAVGPAVARAVTQILEKTVNSAITECFQVQTFKIFIRASFFKYLIGFELFYLLVSFLLEEHHYRGTLIGNAAMVWMIEN